MNGSKFRSLLVLTTALFCLVAARVDAETIAIVGGTVIDGNGGKPIADGVIVIEDKRIVTIGGKGTPIPAGARAIAATGQYVIPGLMDANVHLVLDTLPLTLVRHEGRYGDLALEAAQVTLRNGVTTVFDSWGPRQFLVQARSAVDSGHTVASRIYLAGNIVGLGGPYTDDFWGQLKEPSFEGFVKQVNALWQENVGPELLWMSPEQVRQEIRAYVKKDIDFLKYAATDHTGGQFVQFSPRVQQVIVEEARSAGLTVQTHTMNAEGLYLAVQAGVDLMQHCEVTGPQQRMPAEIVTLIAQRRIPCAILASTDKALAWYREQAEAIPFFKNFDIADLNVRALLKAGAVILLSTDGGLFSADFLNSSWAKDRLPPQEPLFILGEGHFNWLVAVEQKGMKPMEALMAATRNIARAYNVDKDLGTLERGKVADLLILERNPLERAANYRSISLVMKEGRIVDRGALPTRRLLTAPPAPGVH